MHLSRQIKGANFGIDTAVLGLTGLGSLVNGLGTANALSAGAAALTGTRAALSREVYFEKTLPALIATMDAARLNRKTEIAIKVRDLDTTKYSLMNAFQDIEAYEAAASIETAIQDVTTTSGAKVAEQQALFDSTQVRFVIGPPDPPVPALRKTLRATVKAWEAANDTASLTAAATALDLVPMTTATEQAQQIMLAMAAKSSSEDTRQAIARIEKATGAKIASPTETKDADK